jgi:hypothetical protein
VRLSGRQLKVGHVEVPVQQQPDRRRIVGCPLSLHVPQQLRQFRSSLYLGLDGPLVPAFPAGHRVLAAVDPDP